MLNSERIHASAPQSTSSRVNLLEPESNETYVKPRLELSSPSATDKFRFRPAKSKSFGTSIKHRLAAYADSPDVYHVKPRFQTEKRAELLAKKRVVDIVGALILLAVFFPVFLIVAILVKLTSRGPVLFRQIRLGENGQPFVCYKFRTMVQDAEHLLHKHSELREMYLSEFKIKDDPRITVIGKLLRKTSLDELPQLFNVLEGSMSLVGPRPIVPPEIEKYGNYGDKLLAVRPGLTGIWQVCGRSDTTYEERVVMDMFYVDHSNVLMDLQLLVSTVVSVLRCRGAY